MGRCFLCKPPARVPDPELWQHFYEVHELNIEDELERYPDGEIVIYDQSLEPKDFE